MKFIDLLKFLPAIVTLATRLFGKAKTPPRRVEDVLGPADKPTASEDAKAAADAKADAKFGA